MTLREVPLSLEGAYMAISGIGDEDEQEEHDTAAPDAAETEEDAPE